MGLSIIFLVLARPTQIEKTTRRELANERTRRDEINKSPKKRRVGIAKGEKRKVGDEKKRWRDGKQWLEEVEVKS